MEDQQQRSGVYDSFARESNDEVKVTLLYVTLTYES